MTFVMYHKMPDCHRSVHQTASGRALDQTWIRPPVLYLILGVDVPHLLGVVGKELLLAERLVMVAVQSLYEVFGQ